MGGSCVVTSVNTAVEVGARGGGNTTRGRVSPSLFWVFFGRHDGGGRGTHKRSRRADEREGQRRLWPWPVPAAPPSFPPPLLSGGLYVPAGCGGTGCRLSVVEGASHHRLTLTITSRAADSIVIQCGLTTATTHRSDTPWGVF